MENLPDKPQINQTFDLLMFMKGVLQIGFIILIFGGVFILLDKLNIVTDEALSLLEPNPWSIVGGGVVIFALTLIGVPLLPAIVAGGTIGFIVETFFFHK